MKKNGIKKGLTALTLVMMIALSMLLLASCKGTYSIEFFAGGGLESYKTVTAKEGETVEKPEDPILDGAVFEGWYDNDSFAGEAVSFPLKMPKGGMKLYAKFSSAQSVTLTLDGDGVSLAESTYQVAVNTPLLGYLNEKNITDGTAFAGAFLLDGAPINAAYRMPNHSITLKIEWHVSYTVEYYLQALLDQSAYTKDDTKTATLHAKVGSAVRYPQEGITGFSVNESIEGSVLEGTATRDGLTLKLYCDRNVYSLFYDANGGTGTMAPAEARYGEMVTTAENGFTPAGNGIFVNWNTKADGSGDIYAANYSFAISKDITLYAVWATGYADKDGSGDVVFLTGKTGLGAAILRREGKDDKNGFYAADSKEFTFYFDAADGGDRNGKIDEAAKTFTYRDESVYGNYTYYDYLSGREFSGVNLFMDGYGYALYSYFETSEMIKNIYGVVSYTEYNDYMFEEIDPITGEKKETPSFYFVFDRDADAEPGTSNEAVGTFMMQGLESGEYLLYEQGYIYTDGLVLNGYGKAKYCTLYNEETQEYGDIVEGRYVETDDYEGINGEYKFIADDNSFTVKFIISALEGPSGQVVYVFAEKDEDTAGIYYTAAGVKDPSIYLDGYGGALVTIGENESLGNYTIEKGTLTITLMVDGKPSENMIYANIDTVAKTFSFITGGYLYEGSTLTDYVGKSPIVVIPSETEDGTPVTAIGPQAFKPDINSTLIITSVTIPASIESIGDYAFENVNTLLSVTILAETPPAMGTGVFRWPNGKLRILVPDGCEEAYRTADGWKDYANYITSNAEIAARPELEVVDGVLIRYNNKDENPQNVKLKLPDDAVEIAAGVFRDCDYIVEVDLNNVRIIGDNAFDGCTGLQKITGNQVQSVGAYAFFECELLNNVVLPEVTEIGQKAFAYNTALTAITLGGEMTQIGSFAFEECGKRYYYDEEGNPAREELMVYVTYTGTRSFSLGEKTFGDTMFRIKVNNVRIALSFIEEQSSWSGYVSRFITQAGDEAGTYYSKDNFGTELILNGRAELEGFTVLLYEINGTAITFYYATNGSYVTIEGTIKDGIVEMAFEEKVYVFAKGGTAYSYRSDSDDTLTGVYGDTAAKFNGHDVTLKISFNETSFVYNDNIYTLHLDKDGPFSYDITKLTTVSNYTAADGAKLKITEGSIVLADYSGVMIDGKPFGGSYEWATLTDGGYRVVKTIGYLALNLSKQFEIVFTVNDGNGTFTYTVTQIGTQENYQDAVRNILVVRRDMGGTVTGLSLAFRNSAGDLDNVTSTFEKVSDTEYTLVVASFTDEYDGFGNFIGKVPGPYNGTYRVVLNAEAKTFTLTKLSD